MHVLGTKACAGHSLLPNSEPELYSEVSADRTSIEFSGLNSGSSSQQTRRDVETCSEPRTLPHLAQPIACVCCTCILSTLISPNNSEFLYLYSEYCGVSLLQVQMV